MLNLKIAQNNKKLVLIFGSIFNVKIFVRE